jgi:hypothetical protein
MNPSCSTVYHSTATEPSIFTPNHCPFSDSFKNGTSIAGTSLITDSKALTPGASVLIPTMPILAIPNAIQSRSSAPFRRDISAAGGLDCVASTGRCAYCIESVGCVQKTAAKGDSVDPPGGTCASRARTVVLNPTVI